VGQDFYDVKKIRDKHTFAVHLTDKSKQVSNNLKLSNLGLIEKTSLRNQFFDECDTDIIDYIDKDKVLDLSNKNLKAVMPIADNYFHYFSDFVGPVIIFLQNFQKAGGKKIDLVFTTKHPLEVVQNFYSFLEHSIKKFSTGLEISYKTIILDEIEFIKINNFFMIPQLDIGESIQELYESAIDFAECKNPEKPYRKVFITRKHDAIKDDRDNRSINEAEAEDFFKSQGFEIVYGEMFNNLKEQIAYFNSVSVFAGLTGSGLTSSLFMQNGQTVIEIVCPLRFGEDESKYEIHNFYKTISMLKDHNLVSISNINKPSEKLKEDLTKAAKML
jgi:hypothetical protein